MKASDVSARSYSVEGEVKRDNKPPFRRAKDDTKPILQDPILRSDPIETEEAVLRLPPLPVIRSKSQSE
ncbi:uncharacterized protein LOC132271468 [Cornus florida]|uniref:uncharacterized protein LOC132271468 n=1 Tax=Cornus florida TaxID=4283 RepID=UPI00289CCB88|nr:uncharacterized protein LOC132271468 [Cornus florida]